MDVILTFSFKRFSLNQRKNNCLIDFPLYHLDLAKYMMNENQNCQYELYGVCNHSGGTLGGHYTATIRVANNDWYLFNDTTVSKTMFDGKNNTSGYCLFYRKKQINNITK